MGRSRDLLPIVAGSRRGCPGVGDTTNHGTLLSVYQETMGITQKRSHWLAQGADPGQIGR